MCHDLGVAPSRFRGQPVTAHHEYDTAGRLVRVRTESEWTLADRLLMLARAEYLDEFCKGCGNPKIDAWHPDNEGWYDAHAVVCHGCAAIEKARTVDTDPGAMVRAVFTRDYATRPLPETGADEFVQVLDLEARRPATDPQMGGGPAADEGLHVG